ncbi:membrane protein [Anoxybacillus gonensis]|uniref:Uncharacterized protein n=1 Tax=Anoxybacillus gonensis TaxID=198467 RepID=A0AAW7TJB4_9BACL|nr:hypothetical protein [Anoxybacillus gonensis]AKS39686.1 membrane protein [Anoxybacillus gonensis]KGP61712.1 membrane protein [Anoxybacillus gonensis]MDO0878095.1 hypothetical protein [Anoxybacillus gonensis]
MYWWSIQQLFLLLLFSPLLTRHLFYGRVSSFLLFVCFAFGTTVFAEYMVKKKGKQTWLFVAALLCNVSVLLVFSFAM